MFGILVSQHSGEGAANHAHAHDRISQPNAHRLIGILSILAWLPVVALVLKKAV
jgi:hypothetical protein